MAANAIDLTLAATVAGDLGITSDATVQRVVTAASRAIAAYCARRFEKGAAVVEYPPGFGRPFLLLERAPVLSIASITVGGTTLDSTEYACAGRNADAGMVWRRQGVWPRTARDVGQVTPAYDFYEGTSENIVVTYTGGYVTPGQNALDGTTYPTVSLPEDIQEAAILTATAIYRSRGVDAMVASESIGDWAVTYFADKARSTNAVPGPAKALLAPYRMLRVA